MKEVSLIQLGLGGVGRAVVERVLAARDEFELRYGIRFLYVSLCDSAGAAIEPKGFSHGELQRILAAKAQGASLADLDVGYQHEGLADIVDVAGTSDTIVIDVTASDKTVDALKLALQRGYGVVLANKKPLTQSYETFLELTQSGRLRYESTVGSGVPVIATLRGALIAAHDPVHRIEGCLSGTLGFLCTGLQAGQAFSDLVRHAHAHGYSEPDPRDDLGGMDVARKALILARTLGWPLELTQIQVEPLYPPTMNQGSVQDFLQQVSQLDDDYRQRLRVAQTAENVLRYVAVIQGGEAQVGLQEVPLRSPLGQLQGTDNLIAFHSDIYADSPLVLQGRGAGVQGTAAGVLTDMIALSTHFTL
ncbi:MAG: homoserine dehydrogenase [Chloroflexi bacterium]|nr:homoserine dehydrogenase [Chloroflexota bacterium]